MKVIKMTMRDMDEVLEYTIKNPKAIHNQTFEMIKFAHSSNKKLKSISLFKFKLTDDEDLDGAILNVEKHEWELALELGLKFYEDVEEYEMCTKVNELLNKIKNQ